MAGWQTPSKRALIALATVVAVAGGAAVVAGEYLVEPPVDPPADGARLGADDGAGPHQDSDRCGLRGGWHHSPAGILWKV